MSNPERALTEPVTRPDGLSFVVREFSPDLISVDGPLANSFYSRDEILKLGEGDFAVGLAKLGQEYYSAEPHKMVVGATRLLHSALTETS